MTPGLARAPRIARAVGAVSLLVVGGVHFQQYTADYFSAIPIIGPLFLVNFISATAVGLVLLVPMGSAVRFWRLTLDTAAALAGTGIAVGAFAALLISEHTPLFGFMEHGYRLAILIALGAEVVAAATLAAFVSSALRRLCALRGGGSRGETERASGRVRTDAR